MKELIGKTITFAYVDGYIVRLKFDDGSEFYYESDDCGDSYFETRGGEEDEAD